MKFTTSSLEPSDGVLKTDLLVLGLYSEAGAAKISSRSGQKLDQQLGGLLSKLIQKEGLKGKRGEARLVDIHQGGAGRLLLVGLGEPDKFDGDSLRKTVARAIRIGHRMRAKKMSIEDLPAGGKKEKAETRGQWVAEGVLLGSYTFDVYKSDKEVKDAKTVVEIEMLTAHEKDFEKGFQRGVIFAEATNLARDMINVPASDMTPKRVADEAKKIGQLPHLSVKILDKKAIEKLGMGCYLAVAKGSAEPPYFIHLQYRPTSRPKKKIAIIGKGITFDSGGLSLKTAQGMETMKDDMSGAAAMLGVMKALSALKPSVEVHGFSAVTENMPSGAADKPGDIAYAMNGKTVEILNTDAEGRLTLADALGYAQQQKPDLIVDVATLTGACVVALGELCSGIMGNNQKLIDQLIESGKDAGEKIWQLPLIEEYKQDIKSSIADIKNTGGRYGGTINGGLFLQEFVDPKIPWAHIDIAGPSWTEKELDDCPRGGTGHITRTLLNFILKQ
ncbi:MAG: leucyl aminopeptidase [Deltaproteobacteria bacterium]|nr:leucyl aminopeptidase [Deltaproteobacteria bacterium]